MSARERWWQELAFIAGFLFIIIISIDIIIIIIIMKIRTKAETRIKYEGSV